MKSTILSLLFLFGISMTLLMGSCIKEVKTEPDHSVQISFDTLKLSTGTSKQLVCKNYSVDQLIWTSSDSTVAKVNNTGVITAYKKGTALINVKSKTYSVSATCTVTVGEARIINVDTLKLSAGTSRQLVAQNYPATELVWTSSDTTVATVSNTGLITALKPGVAAINVKTKTYSVSETCNVTVTDAKVTDVGVGADGSVFVIGADSASATGGHSIYRVVNGQLHKLPDCAAIRIAVSPQGVPWVVNKSHLIFRYNGTTIWDQMPGTATDIGIGADGSVFTVGTQDVSPTGGYNIMKWNGSGWDTMPDCAGVHIAVGPNGIPWVVNRSHLVFRYGGTYLWDTLYGVNANDVGIGANGSVFVTGADSTAAGYNPPIYQYSGTAWSQLPGISGVSISVDPQGKIWYIDKSGILHKP